MAEYRAIEIPSGDTCIGSNLKPCLLAANAKHFGAYNCRLYGRLLKGENTPRKCAECIAARTATGSAETV
jgi:hypothetical protein